MSSLRRALTSDEINFWAADPMFFTLVWVAIMCLVIICPFIATRERRRLCCRRITERTWNIEGVEVPSILPTSRVIVRAYPIGDPRRRFTKEDADNETKKFILEQLTPFTKVIDENDFIKDGCDVEMGWKDHSLVKNQSSENLATGIENTKAPVTNPTSIEDIADQEYVLENEAEEHISISAGNEPEEEETNSIKSHNDGKEKDGIIVLPLPGVPLEDKANWSNCKNSALKDVERQCILSECSICLTAFSVGDKVSWSSLHCDHAFHQECIVEWLMTLGKKNNSIAESTSTNTIMQRHLCNYNMVCPICRKDFIPNASSST